MFKGVRYFDVINMIMQQSWKGESVQSHVITQADSFEDFVNLGSHKSCEISFTHYLLLSYRIVLECCTEHRNGNGMFCAKF